MMRRIAVRNIQKYAKNQLMRPSIGICDANNYPKRPRQRLRFQFCVSGKHRSLNNPEPSRSHSNPANIWRGQRTRALWKHLFTPKQYTSSTTPAQIPHESRRSRIPSGGELGIEDRRLRAVFWKGLFSMSFVVVNFLISLHDFAEAPGADMINMLTLGAVPVTAIHRFRHSSERSSSLYCGRNLFGLARVRYFEPIAHPEPGTSMRSLETSDMDRRPWYLEYRIAGLIFYTTEFRTVWSVPGVLVMGHIIPPRDRLPHETEFVNCPRTPPPENQYNLSNEF